MTELRYKSPDALRAALVERCKQRAVHTGLTSEQVNRQVAYDRLLTRIFSAPDADQWVLKGGGALLVRIPQARHSLDLDLYRAGLTPQQLEDALRDATRRRIGDYFEFRIRRVVPMVDAELGIRAAITVSLAGREFSSFSTDIVVGNTMTGTPDKASPVIDLSIDGLPTAPYQLYPLVDHIADKMSVRGIRFSGQGVDLFPG